MATNQRPIVDPRCPAAGRQLERVLDHTSETIRALCAETPEVFRSRLRDVLASDVGEHLWRRGIESAETNEAVSLWLRDRMIMLPGGSAWQVPEDPDWTEDPYSNITWETGYQSLGWLATLAKAYREGHTELAEDLRAYLMGWIEANPVGRGKSTRSWTNGTVHRRTNALVAVWDVLLEVLTDEELEKVVRLLHAHGERLESYLSAERFHGHNHNLFHAMALVNLSRNVSLLADADRWREAALQRMNTLLPEMINPQDGVSTEQAAGYHYVAMSLFLEAERYLRLEGRGLSPDDLELLTKTTRFGALLPDSAGYLPAIGDTSYEASADVARRVLTDYDKLGLVSPEAEYLLSAGERGMGPPEAAFFEGEGYAIFRPSDDLHVVVDMGPEPRVHGHNDAMNVLLSAYGSQLLVDSGGPYRYGVDQRDTFTSAPAHNVVLLDGAADDEGGTIERAADSATYSLVSGVKRLSSSVTHRRTVLLVKPSLLLVIDGLTSTDEENHAYQLIYHLPPMAGVSTRASSVVARVDDVALGMAVTGDTPVVTEIVDGWVTRKLATREAAPVLRFTQSATTAWFVTALLAKPAGEAPELSVDARRTAGGYRMEVASHGEVWDVVVPDAGEPTVERVTE